MAGYGDPDDDLDAFIAGVEVALIRLYGQNHQERLAATGPVVSRFQWSAAPPPPIRPFSPP